MRLPWKKKRRIRLWHRHRPGKFPENPTGGTPEYDPKLWRYECAVCGFKAPPASVRHVDGGVSLMPPEGWGPYR